MLNVHNLNSGYEGLQVLYQVDLEVGDGEAVALFGPNGHGKSTLLKALCGLHPPKSGSIQFCGQELSRLSTHQIVESGLVYIPEARDLFSEMTVEENLRMGAYIRRAAAKCKENLALVYDLFPRLYERRSQTCSTLSGGESRMVAIGRGMMSAAKMLLVDEPSIGLSPLMTEAVFGAIHRINTEAGITVLIVEQEVGHALQLVNRVYMLKKGRIIFERQADDVDVKDIEAAYF